MSEAQEESSVQKDDSMDIDVTHSESNKELILQNFDKKSEVEKLSTIKKFLMKHPDPLSQQQLDPLAITYEDFVNALPTVQPSAREKVLQQFQTSHGKMSGHFQASEWSCICVLSNQSRNQRFI